MFELQFIQKGLRQENRKTNCRISVRGIIYDGEKLLMVRTAQGDYLFPGGGREAGETMEEALRREIAEETGYTEIAVGPCVGTAIQLHEDWMEPNALFRMESRYYVCRLTGMRRESRRMEIYEKRLDYRGVFVTPGKAWKNNYNMLTERSPRIRYAQIPWLERETQVLRELVDSKTDRLALEVYECGQMLRDAARRQMTVDEKDGHANFVTVYDRKTQEALRARFRYWMPEAVFVGEEDDIHASLGKGYAFIVDPIDGTTNFIKDYHASCISAALIRDGVRMAAVVYNPYLDEMYTAVRGKGAYLNGVCIRVSDQPLSRGLVLFGTSPYHEELAEESFRTAYAYFRRALDIRRSGSAALDLCSIAAGRAELYFERRLSPWDYAAGSLIVEEAGGVVTTMEGGPLALDAPCSVLAGNARIMAEEAPSSGNPGAGSPPSDETAG